METCCEECFGHQRALSPWTDDDDDDPAQGILNKTQSTSLT